MLIGNFAKLILPERKRVNYKRTLKVASKLIDNIEINDASEFKEFLSTFRNSYDSKQEAINSLFKNKARELISNKLYGRPNLLGKLKKFYQTL